MPRSAAKSSSFSNSGVLARNAFHCSRPKVTYRLIGAGQGVCVWSNWPQNCIFHIGKSEFDWQALLIADTIDVMPTRNVNLTDELDRFVLAKVKSGRYENASEVVRAALRTLEREEQEYEAKLASLRAAIDKGDASGGIAAGNPFVRVRKALKRPLQPR
jgi:antitoxin ParD1/3/4